ncbi:flagellar hook-associated protein FlgK [Bradyrhizobium sp. ARR65]|uniref:flagellar hook-associated protein FlgK n=1 Tax=Bradyrhizobium sp. ARR65 TaxID=1040989 RepID=UPI0004663FA4|nr:flagellar hook-associated protein FlgK [Bradyrhizobium sp. ARR65]
MSSLDIARLIAFSGLSAAQVQISVASSNISNADTAGYTEETANQASMVTAGVGTGVTITGISTTIDKLLLKSLIGATSDLGSANTTNNYLTELEQLYGTVDGSTTSDSTTTGTSLANTLASFESALSSLEATPSSPSLQSNVISALNAVTTQLQDTSSSIQDLRSNADQDIASSVQSINADLKQIADLNKEIKQEAATGQSTADLEDQRNSALQDLASMMNVNYYTTSSGDLQVYTTSGQPLVDSTAHTLSYTTASNVTASTTYASGGFSGITVNGIDITSQITSGKVGALITLRDKALPAAQSQLDELAQNLISTVNAVSNQGTSVPPPTSLTGTTTVRSTDAFSGTGTVRIAETDTSGNLVGYQDFDLSSYSTVGDLVDAINSGSSTSHVTASIDSSGHLVLTAADSGDGVSVNEMTSSVGSSDQGFSDYFGLNDLLTGSNASDIAVRSDLLSGSAALPTATLDSSTTLSAGSQVLSSGSATIVDALDNAMTGSTSFAAAGGLAATTGSFADYAAAIVSNIATQASQASSNYTLKETAQSSYANSMSSESGVNIDEETARLSALQNKYSAASELIQTINSMFSSLISAIQAG